MKILQYPAVRYGKILLRRCIPNRPGGAGFFKARSTTSL